MKRFIVSVLLSITSLQVSAETLVSENTYGVETVENSGTHFYLAPILAINGLMNQSDADTATQLGFGFNIGVLVSEQLLIEGALRRHEMKVAPSASALPVARPLDALETFSYSKNSLDLGVRLFVLGRDSRIRPYLSGGGVYSFGKLNYTNQALTIAGSSRPFMDKEFSLNQFSARGSLGAELAITSMIVANAQFGIEGVVGYSAPKDTSAYDLSKLSVANSLSRAMTYTLSAGLGFYL